MRVGKPSPTRMVNQFRTHVQLSDISLIVVKYGAYHGMIFSISLVILIKFESFAHCGCSLAFGMVA